MYLTNREGLLGLPAGTLYSEFTSCVTDSLSSIKEFNGPYGGGADWLKASEPEFPVNSSDEIDTLNELLMGGGNVPLALVTEITRDALYDLDMMYLILSDEDKTLYLHSHVNLFKTI